MAGYLHSHEDTHKVHPAAAQTLCGTYREGVMHKALGDFAMPPEAAVERAAASLRLLADPTRLKVLWALAQGESNVTCLAELAGVTPTVVSQHLAKLRLSGLVTTRREGTFIYYSVADAHVAALLAEAVRHAGHGHRDVEEAVSALENTTSRSRESTTKTAAAGKPQAGATPTQGPNSAS